MAWYKKLHMSWESEDVELEPSELMTIAEAAEELGIAVKTMAGYLDVGRFSVVVDESAPERQGRRLVLRREVEERKAAS